MCLKLGFLQYAYEGEARLEVEEVFDELLLFSKTVIECVEHEEGLY